MTKTADRSIPLVAACLILSGLVSGCATPASRLETALVGFGVPRQPAQCVASHMSERLSRQQMNAAADLLEGAGNLDRAPANSSMVSRAFDTVMKASDPDIVVNAARAGAACVVLGNS